MKFLASIALFLVFTLLLTACGTAPPISAQQRLFGNFSLEFLDEYQLPKQVFSGTPVGGLSAIAYDRQKDRLYAVSDDRSLLAPARFYTLRLTLKQTQESGAKIEQITVENVTTLKDATGQPYPPGALDSEGLALSPRDTVFISSEGDVKKGISPLIGEFNRKTGQLIEELPIPGRYLPNSNTSGVQQNLAFEALAIAGNNLLKDDPFRLFVATESALVQDNPLTKTSEGTPIRLLHYLINSVGSPVIIAEHLYRLDKAASDTLSQGLTELVALDEEGYFLSLERSLGLSGFGAKIFEVITGNATDTSQITSLQDNLEQIEPMKKKLLLDLSTLGVELDNLEGMTLGPRLADGSQTLITVSDDNFRDLQVTQFLLFRLS
jgi:hypothetical protein